MRWIQHFHDQTQASTRSSKRLLLLDSHGSYLTAEFEQFCKDHGIITLCLPPHSSHRLQTLNVGYFRPLKKAYTARLDRLFRASYYTITKDDFLAEIAPAMVTAFTVSNIQNSFRGSGIVPFNPDAVLSKLTLKERTLTLPQGQPSWTTTTLSNPHEIDCQTA